MTLQQEIIRRLQVKPEIDAKEEIRRSVDFMKEYLRRHPFLESLVLGLSLGQDSTLAGKLAQMACDELNGETGSRKYRFIGVRLPYGVQADQYDEMPVLEFIRPHVLLTVNIQDQVDASVRAVEAAAGSGLSDFLKGNIKARHRMEVQYTIAGVYKGVVLGTDHAAEAVAGFFTKHGDGAADLVPLYRLNKRQGRQMMKELGSPERLYLKEPTADLEDNKPLLPDEKALGVSYEDIDDYLEGKEVPEESRRVIEGHYLRSEHKRHPSIGVNDDWWRLDRG